VCSESIYGLNYILAKRNVSTCAASCGNRTTAENTITTFENICSVVQITGPPAHVHIPSVVLFTNQLFRADFED
jgi:hypothetical protein